METAMRNSASIKFSELDKQHLLYMESYLSGRFSRMLGAAASNCVTVAVTLDALWTTFSFPFHWMVHIYPVERCIPKKTIISITPKKRFLMKRSILIEYRMEDGRLGSVEIFPRDYIRFSESMRI